MRHQRNNASSVIAMEEKRINRVFLLFLLNGVYFFSYFQRVGVPGTVFNELQSGFSLSATAVAGLGALTFFTGGLLFSLGSVLFSFAYSPAMLFIMRAFVGFGASFIFISLVKILTGVYEPEDFPFWEYL